MRAPLRETRRDAVGPSRGRCSGRLHSRRAPDRSGLARAGDERAARLLSDARAASCRTATSRSPAGPERSAGVVTAGSSRARTRTRPAARPGRRAPSWATPPAQSRAAAARTWRPSAEGEEERRAHQQRERVEGDHVRSSAEWSACRSGSPRRRAARGTAPRARSLRTGSPASPARASRAPTAPPPRA
jgi:hypothetical protein